MAQRHPESGREMVKVRIRLQPAAWHRIKGENLWAERIDERRYRLSNIPCLAYGVSFNDVVFASVQHGELTFEGVSIHSGHSTYRLFMLDGVSPEAFREHWQPLKELGCGYEGGQSGPWAVDVPPNADLNKAIERFEQGERDGIWEFEEGHRGHL